MLRSMLFVIALSTPVMNVPVQSTQSSGPPIVVDDCSIAYHGSVLLGRVDGIRIEFTNESTKTADLVNFRVTAGDQSATVRDVGTFSSGVEVRHKFKTGKGEVASPLFTHTQMTCAVQSAHFTDGSTWNASGSAPTPAVAQSNDSYLGFELSDSDAGIFVRLIQPGGPAALAGIRQGDRIISIGGDTVQTASDVSALIASTKPGMTIAVVVDRAGSTETLSAIVGLRPDAMQ